MPVLDAMVLQQYRAQTYRWEPQARVRTPEGALAFLQARGFLYFWPIKDVTLPSLWVAVAGNRPVPSAHHDPGHITWGWKDQMLDKRQWYYAKVLRGKATLISLETVPYFYALSENYGDPDEDYLQLYRDGVLSQAGKVIYETLLRTGPLDTVNLRRTIHMTSKASNSPFERGLTELQRDFKILPVGVAQAGAWRYSFIYDLVHRFYPALPEQAQPITRQAARRHLTQLFFQSVGAATANEVRKLFGWKPPEVNATLSALVEAGDLAAEYTLPTNEIPHYVVPALQGH